MPLYSQLPNTELPADYASWISFYDYIASFGTSLNPEDTIQVSVLADNGSMVQAAYAVSYVMQKAFGEFLQYRLDQGELALFNELVDKEVQREPRSEKQFDYINMSAKLSLTATRPSE